MYGTAWKEDDTARLVRLALDAGFRAIDTANQRKHYFEAGVGEAVAAAGVPREKLFLQTKFTYARGQDHRLPYDPRASFATQVEQSFAISLEHLGTSYVDSFVLHGPASGRGLTPADREVWTTMEALAKADKTRLLGVSNVSLEQLAAFVELASVPIAFVQNRCYARTGWDRDVRALCRREGIVYQGFSLLTANERELRAPRVRSIAARLGVGIPEVVFRFAHQLGMLPLTGTSDPEHMRQDLGSLALELDAADVEALEQVAFA
ncbi:MAG: aldo/keto reductase [Polyangiaceae bacterium]|nr:aldo/keto reductase [Polyangiaceae bacterium]MCE7893090.1 aldo/keto reductase [Sorangiineae bacterium PRO1]